MKSLELALVGAALVQFSTIAPSAAMSLLQTAGMTAPSTSYTDGSFQGPSINAYYGNVQMGVKVAGGQIVGFQLYDFPHHTNTSMSINEQALPMLAQEVLKAQSAQVDIVSGATLTSEAFIKSIDGALVQARNTAH